jgi:2-isopropylmalate synthase
VDCDAKGTGVTGILRTAPIHGSHPAGARGWTARSAPGKMPEAQGWAASGSPMIQLYDTTLRDGSQGEGVSFTVQDKLRIARRLDEMGIHYIEGGWPGSNPKDIAFFEAARDLRLTHAKLCAFGSTRRKAMRAAEDPLVLQLAESGAPVVTIFGKSWLLHVHEVLSATADENLEMIRDTVAFLKSRDLEVVYDAEHFFDGYAEDPEYALRTLEAAQAGGAGIAVLCDTNGGAMPWEIAAATRAAGARLRIPVGIHTHNDCELGVANTIAGVQAGAVQVQGTINGLGERTGNANLTSIIPVLKLKMGLDCISDEQLRRLADTAAFVDELANLAPNEHQPWIGRSAFAHKAGTHADAVRKNPRTCEHIDPTLVGNHRRILVSELSGGSTVVWKAEEAGLELDKKDPATRRILEKVARLESEGWVFEGAEASFELLVQKETGGYQKAFDLISFRVLVVRRGQDQEAITEATLKVSVNGEERLTVAEGDGPVNALDAALRKSLLHFYPELEAMRLTDYKVRVVDVKEGTAAKVRVLVESADEHGSWSTIGVSTNIIEASWLALADSVEYAPLKRRGGA